MKVSSKVIRIAGMLVLGIALGIALSPLFKPDKCTEAHLALKGQAGEVFSESGAVLSDTMPEANLIKIAQAIGKLGKDTIAC